VDSTGTPGYRNARAYAHVLLCTRIGTTEIMRGGDVDP